MNKLILVETVRIERVRYVVECKSEEHAMDSVVCHEPKQKISQTHLDEPIVSTRELSQAEYIRLFDLENPFQSHLSDADKLTYIHKVQY
jgi:hypothetical protein